MSDQTTTPAPYRPAVGDRVRVIGDLTEKYGYIEDARKYVGKTGTVKFVFPSSALAYGVKFKGEKDTFNFAADELIPCPRKAKPEAGKLDSATLRIVRGRLLSVDNLTLGAMKHAWANMPNTDHKDWREAIRTLVDRTFPSPPTTPSTDAPAAEDEAGSRSAYGVTEEGLREPLPTDPNGPWRVRPSTDNAVDLGAVLNALDADGYEITAFLQTPLTVGPYSRVLVIGRERQSPIRCPWPNCPAPIAAGGDLCEGHRRTAESLALVEAEQRSTQGTGHQRRAGSPICANPKCSNTADTGTPLCTSCLDAAAAAKAEELAAEVPRSGTNAIEYQPGDRVLCRLPSESEWHPGEVVRAYPSDHNRIPYSVRRDDCPEHVSCYRAAELRPLAESPDPLADDPKDSSHPATPATPFNAPDYDATKRQVPL